ncbi:hypothetical protein K0B04_01310 [Patescibacteria group bacterium]|nr:hypothetical protein [Patescibacteria group bacterium]
MGKKYIFCLGGKKEESEGEDRDAKTYTSDEWLLVNTNPCDQLEVSKVKEEIRRRSFFKLTPQDEALIRNTSPYDLSEVNRTKNILKERCLTRASKRNI